MPSKNPQVGRASSRRWRKRHPEEVREQKKRHYAKHRERIRLMQTPLNLAKARELRQRIIATLGGRCQRCGLEDWRALQVDHINGGGRKDRRRFANKSEFLRAVVEERDAYQLLCANCNWIKRYERGEYRSPKTPKVAQRQTPLFAALEN